MLSAGDKFGHFEIHDELGRGGMAVVFLATDTRTNQDVALKILYDQWMNDPEVVKRFVREAEVISALSHQHIVPINDYGNIDGRLYLALGYMDGGTLSDKFANPRKVSLKATLHLLKQVAVALDYAHKQGVIHRDLKLQNILLDSDNNVYLTDFGIARLNDSTRLTATGHVAGTPMYMSPEQARGDKIDSRTDIYSFSVMAYLMLTGFYPFTAPNPIAIIQKHLHESPPLPSKVNPRLPEAVDSVLLRGLEKQSNNRYESASAMFSELVRAVKTQNVEVATTTTIIKTSARNPIQSEPITRRVDGGKIQAPVNSPTQTIASRRNQSFAVLGFGVAMIAVLLAVVAMVSASQPDDILPTSAAAMLPTVDATQVLLQFQAELTATSEYLASLPTETFTPTLTYTPSPTVTPTTTPTVTPTLVPSATITDTPMPSLTPETTPIEFLFPESDAQVNVIEGAPVFYEANEEEGQVGILPFRSLLELYGRDALGEWVEAESRQGFAGWMRTDDIDVYIDVLTLPITWNEAEFVLDEEEFDEDDPDEPQTTVGEVTVITSSNSNNNNNNSNNDNTSTGNGDNNLNGGETGLTPDDGEIHTYVQYETWMLAGPGPRCPVVRETLQPGWKVEILERPYFTDEWLLVYIFEIDEGGYVETIDLEPTFNMDDVPVDNPWDFDCVENDDDGGGLR